MTSADAVDLTNCDREPIHIPGHIQAHGVLLVFDAAVERLQFASANVAAFLGLAGPLAAGLSLKDIIGENAAHDVRNAVVKAVSPGQGSLILGLELEERNRIVDCRVHSYAGRTLIELEQA